MYSSYNDDALVVLLAILGIAFLIGIVIAIFYLLTLSRTLALCAPQNRTIEPGQVWLQLIPIFGIIWNFIMVNRIADTLANEFRMRNIPSTEQRPGYQVGITMAICGAVGFIPYIGTLAGIVQLIMWIIYWVKMSGFKTQLEQTPFQFSNMNPNPNNYQYQNQNYGYQQPQQPQQYGNPYSNNPYNQNPPPPPPPNS
ncbi:MAG: hypothetical protein L6Q81_13460 [Bacteroidia bacterium]|nr:hypothetical protein [Bacteroidia bacterium]